LAAAALAVTLTAISWAGEPHQAVPKALQQAFDSVQRVRLDNGARLLIREDYSAPVVAVQIWVGTGSIHEQEHLGAGLSHSIEHMIFKGTETRGVGVMTRQINDAGGDINAYTTFDRTVFHTDLPARHWKLGLDALTDAVLHSTFPESEWAKEKQVIIREIAMGRDDPGRILGKLLWETAFTVHPYRHPVIGYEDIVSAVTRGDLQTFARKNYTPDNMIVVVVGAAPCAEVEAEVRRLLGSVPRRARAPVVLPEEPAQASPRFSRKTGAYTVSRLELAWPAVPLQHPDAATLDLLAEVVGSGRSSRLVQSVQEKKRLVSYIDAWSYTPRHMGLFGLSATFAPDKEGEVLEAIQAEVQSWTAGSFSKAEIVRARQMILTATLSGLQTMQGQAAGYASGEFFADDPGFSATYLRRLAGITSQDLVLAARKYLRPEWQTLVILSPEVAPVTNAAPTLQTTSVVTVQRRVLPSGIPLLVREDRRLPFVNASAVFRGGLLSEPDQRAGITRMMTELLTRGTSRHSSAEIAEMVESRGASLSGFSGLNSFGLQMRCLVGDAPVMLELMAECLTKPAFAVSEVEHQRNLQLATIAQESERPLFKAQQAVASQIFPGHPYRWTPNGTVESVRTISRKDILSHAERHLLAGNMVLAVFGDISAPDAATMAANAFRHIPPGSFHRAAISPPSPALPSRVDLTEPRQQAVAIVGFPGVSLTDPRYDTVTLIQTAMSGLSSDLSKEVREKRGLAYYVGAYNQSGIEPGVFALYAGIRTDSVNEVLNLYAQEIGRIAENGLRQDEIDRARNQLVADFEMGLQNPGGLAFTCALNEIYGLGADHVFSTARRLEALTADQVRETARSLLNTNRMATAVVFPAAPDAPSAPTSK
jgi:zinc protease